MELLTPAEVAKHLWKLSITKEYVIAHLLTEDMVGLLIRIEFPNVVDYTSKNFVKQVYKSLTSPKNH